MKYILLICLQILFFSVMQSQTQSDSIKLEQLRRESGVDPTRVQSRAGYTFLIYDQKDDAGQINNRASLNIGVGRWSLSAKYEIVTKSSGVPATGFTSGAGDIKFSVLNAFMVKGKHSLACSAEFSIPTGKSGFGSQYFSVTPAMTYSLTINPGLFLAVQPQYTFQLMKDPVFPELSVLTVRTFLAKFTSSGYFFVFEPRVVADFTGNAIDFIFSPIIGKSLGAGFNLIVLSEIPTGNTYRENRGILYQFGFNKNF